MDGKMIARIGAVVFGHEQMQPVIDLIIDFAEIAAKEPFNFSPPDISALYGRVAAAGETHQIQMNRLAATMTEVLEVMG